MTIHFGYEKSKVMQALRYHFISRPEIRTMLIIVNVFALISVILYALEMVTGFAFLVGSFLWLLLMISFWFILPFSAYRSGKLTFSNEFDMDFTDDGFALRSGRGGNQWKWNSLSTLVESPHFFHLYFDPRRFILVPKDAFSSIEQMQELRKLIRSKIN